MIKNLHLQCCQTLSSVRATLPNDLSVIETFWGMVCWLRRVVSRLRCMVRRLRGMMRSRVAVMRGAGVGDLGHEAGISVVHVVCDCLYSAVRKQDVVRPFGGVTVARFVMAVVDTLEIFF